MDVICVKGKKILLITSCYIMQEQKFCGSWSFPCLGLVWVIHFSRRPTLFSSHGSFVGKNWKRVWTTALLCLFWTIWKETNWKTFENVKQSEQVLKFSFIYNFLDCVKHCMDDVPLSMVDFVDWLGSK